ncbi:MAG: hypothetical protein RLZZ59_574 [Pseudomonadota bacterium]|jgi:lysophospholipid acyltransferase (LPLAT)-like uncharacterized protein
MVRGIKKILKSSILAKNIIAFLINIYLRMVYSTTSWRHFFPNTSTKNSWILAERTIALTWHDKLAILPHEILHFGNRMHILASPHSDGAIIASILKFLGFSIIYGSTNKDSIKAVRSIMSTLNAGDNISITPDGPRGPRHQINSSIIEIGKRCNAKMICVSCVPSRYLSLKSWDRLIIPLPFGTIDVYYSEFMDLNEKSKITNDDLQSILNNLTVGKYD